MKKPVDIIFPPSDPGEVPYFRLVLRGVSQLCFQSNELTGLFFLAAVLVASPIAFAYLLAAAIIAPGARMLLGEKRPVLATGLPGLNPCLIALSLPAFFQTGWTNVGMWGVLLLSVVVIVALVRLFVAIFPFPILVMPFLIVFWVLFALAPRFDVLQPIVFSSVSQAGIHPVTAMFLSMGQVAFSPTILSGLLFTCGIFLSNWRHGLIAVFGAIIGTVTSIYNGVDPASINLGLYGFNGVLAAVSAFVLCDQKLRLSILGAILATMLIPVVADFGVNTLSAPFVLTTWLMLALGWIENNWFVVLPEAAPGE